MNKKIALSGWLVWAILFLILALVAGVFDLELLPEFHLQLPNG